ncbi:cupin domain-containing protein [Halovivax gelatinilyticus]|uniref:cupin domain-containing protein n=1 Tax=Halovivax gelatinilyticus TaxID=2961597 RepID=UPI0020CA5504|nr:cupin domain-containing protein [Halovivax gelatinilyticus]
MERVHVERDGDRPSIARADVFHRLSKPLGTDHLAVNYVELDPGSQLGWDYHRHLDQEEVFFVTAGTVTFETEEGDQVLGPGELIRFEPGEFQLAKNRGDERATMLALGAPRGSRELEYLRECPACETETIQTLEFDRDRAVFEVFCDECDEQVTEIEPS